MALPNVGTLTLQEQKPIAMSRERGIKDEQRGTIISNHLVECKRTENEYLWSGHGIQFLLL